MNEINVYIGGQIRKYRKANGMTLQQLADVIHKSRATACKYENGEISIDIATLYEISQALQVSFGQLTSYQPTLPPSPPPPRSSAWPRAASKSSPCSTPSPPLPAKRSSPSPASST